MIVFFSRIIPFLVLVGETCVNNENLNGTVFGQFRCPLYGFPHEAKYCCGEHGHQYCCERQTSRFTCAISYIKTYVLIILVVLRVDLHILHG
jgi:hypothetical protein